MDPVVFGTFVILCGGILALFFNSRQRIATLLGAGSCVTGCLVIFIALIRQFFHLYEGDFQPLLSNLFLLPVALVGGLAAVHATGYLSGKHDEERCGIFWVFYNLTLAAMICVTQTKTPIGFLLTWEGMGLFSFALVAYEYHTKESMKAAWIYFLACQAGGALILMMFLLSWNGAIAYPLAFFLCGFLGFGLKIGFPLLHIWLPEAHPAAPAPVSALLSAGMINLGYFGILRWMLNNAAVPVHYLGYGFLITGVAGALLGILFALPQKNLKRLLAYSSIENMGIMGIGFGLAFLGKYWENPYVAFPALCGAFLHLLNHAMLKGGLFLAAGNVLKSTGTLNMELLGGLQKRLSSTGTCFTLSAIGLSGLPPANAFLGELLIYIACGFGIATSGNGLVVACCLIAMVTLALCGGLAATVYAKAIGAVFLGEPRTDFSRLAKALPRVMTLPLRIFLGICVVLMLVAIPVAGKVCYVFTGWSPCGEHLHFDSSMPAEVFIFIPLAFAVLAAVVFALLSVVFWFLRRRALPRGKVAEEQGTWDCGFIRPDARMEYTGIAFVQPLVDLFAGILRPLRNLTPPRGLFPATGEVEITCPDGGERGFWKPLAVAFGKIALVAHRFQSGHLHLYILFMMLALLVMLLWGFVFC